MSLTYSTYMNSSILQTEQGEVGWANVWKKQGGAVRSLTYIYSLGQSLKWILQAFKAVESFEWSHTRKIKILFVKKKDLHK